MVDKEKLLSLILGEVSRMTKEAGITAAVDANSPLIGSKKILDSVHIVTLLVFLEDHLLDTYKIQFDWTSDSAMSAMSSFLRTPSSLAEHIAATYR